MNSSVFFRIDAPILYIETLEDNLLGMLCTNAQLYIIDKTNQSIFAQYNISRISLNAKGVRLSKNALYFAYIQDNPNQLNVIDLASQKLIHTIATHRHNVEIVQFDSQSKYIIAGTKTGRVFLWSVASSAHIARLSSFPEYSKNMLATKENFVSVIEAFEDLSFTSGYDGSVVITNLQTQFNTKRIHTGFSRVTAIAPINSKLFLCSSGDGVLQKIHLSESVEISSVNSSIRNITQMLALSDNKHLLITNQSSQITLIDYEQLKIISMAYISSTSIIEHISLDEEDRLYIALKNGTILEYELKPLEKFIRLVQLHSYEEAYLLASEAIILKSTQEYKDLDRTFLETYHKAQEALLDDHKVYAHSLLKEFIKVPAKSKIIHNLFYAMQHYQRLNYLLSLKQYAAAYTLAESYQPLQLTPAYKQMQKQFESAFGEAQKAVLQKDNKRAKVLLSPFATVSQKTPLIHLIINSPLSIIKFTSAIHKKEYKNITNLASSFAVLKTLTSYKEFEQSCDALVDKFIFALQEKFISQAELYLDEIKEIPRFSSNIKSYEILLKESKRFYHHYDNKHFLQCFMIIDRAASIAILPLVKELNSEWNDLMLDCETLAQKGDITSIKSILLDLIELQSRETKLANIFRTAYQSQLHTLIDNQEAKALVVGFENYLNIFGIDTEILDLIALADKKSLSLQLKKSLYLRKPRSSWFIYKNTLPDFIYTKV